MCAKKVTTHPTSDLFLWGYTPYHLQNTNTKGTVLRTVSFKSAHYTTKMLMGQGVKGLWRLGTGQPMRSARLALDCLYYTA